MTWRSCPVCHRPLRDSARPGEPLMTPGEVMDVLGVTSSTLTRYEATGWLVPAMKTQGGHRRYLPADVERRAGRPMRARPVG